MAYQVGIIGAGLAGSEVALSLAKRGIPSRLIEMRPNTMTPVHKSGDFAELVCSNSLKTENPDSAAGMLKLELEALESQVFAAARRHEVKAGGALAVDRVAFAHDITALIEENPLIEVIRREATDLVEEASKVDALVCATGPLTSDALSQSLMALTGSDELAFYDAAAPIVMASSLNNDVIFRQSRYVDASDGSGDYLNIPLTREEYEAFVDALVSADRVIAKDFESHELFQACQPIEEVARSGLDALRFGALKPVGLTDPRTGSCSWAVVQLRAEDTHGLSYNLVGFQTNLTFPEQRRVFRMIPGLEQAEFARYGVMHRNTFIDAPRLLDKSGRLITPAAEALGIPVYVAGQLSGTEGYCEAMRSGLHIALCIAARVREVAPPIPPCETAFGSLLAYANGSDVAHYQPMHVNFGLMEPLSEEYSDKKDRYHAYAQRGREALKRYCDELVRVGLLDTSFAEESIGNRTMSYADGTGTQIHEEG